MCKVTDNAKAGENITNIADITEYKDEDNKDVVDRDSQANNVQLPKDEELPGYKDNEKKITFQDNKMMMILKSSCKKNST